MPHWTGFCLAIPRERWNDERNRAELQSSGVYVLSGSAEGSEQDLPTIYVGQADHIANRMKVHLQLKDYWDWCYVFVSPGQPLTLNVMSWLESNLYDMAKSASKSIVDNRITPRIAQGLTKADEVASKQFLARIQTILSLLGVTAFEVGNAVERDLPVEGGIREVFGLPNEDTIVVPAQAEGFADVFIGENAWYSIRISGGRLSRMRYIAAYQVDPVSAVTHYAEVERIERLSNEGKYKVYFKGPAIEIPPVRAENRARYKVQAPRYTSLEKLLKAERLDDLWGK